MVEELQNGAMGLPIASLQAYIRLDEASPWRVGADDISFMTEPGIGDPVYLRCPEYPLFRSCPHSHGDHQSRLGAPTIARRRTHLCYAAGSCMVTIFVA